MGRNKYRKTMQQNSQAQQIQEPEVSEQTPEVQNEVSTQEDTVQTAIETVVQPTINVGSVVQNASSKLGSSLTDNKVKEILAQPSKAPAEQPLSQFEKKISEFLANADSNQKMMVEILRRYVTEMAPGLIFEEYSQMVRAHKNQAQLFNIIRTVLKNDQTFIDNWRVMTMFFRNYKDGALGNQYPFRFMESLTLINNEERQAFMNILTLLTISAGVQDKKQVSKYINLDKAIHRIFGDDVRQRVINYYS